MNVSSSAGKVANMKDSPIKEKLISSGSTLAVRIAKPMELSERDNNTSFTT